jgi:site-specific recombinase XerC
MSDSNNIQSSGIHEQGDSKSLRSVVHSSGAPNLSHKKAFKHKRSSISECIHYLHQVIKQNNHLNADGSSGVSDDTSRTRRDILEQGFRVLNDLGYKIRKVCNFNNTHMQALASYWESQPLSASTLQWRFSVFRTFSVWIGKKGMVGVAAGYLKNPELAMRLYVANEDKGWVGKGVEIMPKIELAFSKDPFVGIHLLIMWSFGLSTGQAWQFHPKDVEMDSKVVDIKHGPMNGQEREEPIMTPWQQQVLAIAKSFANDSSGTLIPSRYKRGQWRTHFYRICDKCGISRKHGIVPFGLRHERANDIYKELTGTDSPVRGGVEIVEGHLHAIDAQARLIVAKTLGHSRTKSVGAYLGKKPRKKNTPKD